MFRSSFCFSRRRQHTRWPRDWSSDVCSSDLQVGIDYKELPEDCQAGDLLLLDDGRVVLEVESINGPRVSCVTRIGGPLSNNKGINRQGEIGRATSELQSRGHLVCRLLLEKKKKRNEHQL